MPTINLMLVATRIKRASSLSSHGLSMLISQAINVRKVKLADFDLMVSKASAPPLKNFLSSYGIRC